MPHVPTVDDIRPPDATWIGFAQALSMIPGTSRSGATIMGGLLRGLSRPAATEFSFFLAIRPFSRRGFGVIQGAALFGVRRSAVIGVGFDRIVRECGICRARLDSLRERPRFQGFRLVSIGFGLLILANLAITIGLKWS